MDHSGEHHVGKVNPGAWSVDWEGKREEAGEQFREAPEVV